MYKLFLCLRYLRKRRIAFFAVLAVGLCVAMVLVVMSVMGGFLNMVRDRSRGMLGDLVVESDTLQGFPFYQEFIYRLKREMPNEVAEATPVIITYGILRYPDGGMTKPVQMVGIRLEETYRVNDFKNGLFYEKYYPGTTTLAPRQQPYLGMGAGGRPVLPAEVEAARRKWQANTSQRDIDDAWRHRLLICDDVPEGGFARELNKGVVSDELRAEVEKHFQVLPDRLEVRVVDKGKKWVLSHADGLFIVERDGDKLKVYHCRYTGPGYYVRGPEPIYQDGPGWTGKALPGIIIGTDLCADRLRTGGYRRYCYRGEPVQLSLVPFSAMGQPETLTGPQNIAMRYVDDCRTGVYDVDSMSVYVDFDLLQDKANMTAYAPRDTSLDADPNSTIPADVPGSQPTGPKIPARTTQVQVKLKPSVKGLAAVVAARNRVEAIWKAVSDAKMAELRDAPLVTSAIEGPVSWVKVQTWEEKQARYIGAVEKEKYLVTILFGVIGIVAVFLVGVILYMIVQQKTRDIGIIKSVGATSGGVAQIFLSYGAAVGIVGGALGTLIGTVFVWYINDIQDLLIMIHPAAQVWNPEVYAFDRIPSEVAATDAIGIYIAAILASVAGSLIAALKASTIWPVEALRYE